MPVILLSSPVRGIKGKFSNSDVCYFVGKNGLTYARSAGDVDNPKTANQQSVRSFFTTVSKAWSTLTVAQRNAWQDYAELYFRTDDNGAPVLPSGINTFVKANTVRLILGQAIVPAAPVSSPPSPLTAIEQLGAVGVDALGISITHAISPLTGLQVIVKMTPAMATVARAPQETDYRLCKGPNSGSAQTLTASGTDLTFNSTVYSINDGERFGVEARIVRTADGIMSMPVYGDFIKVI